jgi:hypothetical protein
MKWLNGYRIRFVLFGFVAAVVLAAGGRAKADFVFGTPENLGPTLNTSSQDSAPSISADGLSLYFSSNRAGGYGAGDLYVATRESTDDDWGPAVNLGPTVNTAFDDWMPSISADGLSLFFGSTRPGGFGGYDLWVTTRATKADEWGVPVNLRGINGPTDEFAVSISSDGLSLYFASNRAGGRGSLDLWVTTRATLSGPWGPPANLGSTVNSSEADIWPSISADGLALFFECGPGNLDDLWVTRRATVSDAWGLPVNLGPRVNLSAADDACPSISADGRTLYFTSNRPGGYGGYDLWKVSIIPIVDFTSDGKVDIQDLLRLIESWGKDDPSVDIGPMPWGDGKVNEKDLEVLMRYWQQEVNDPRLAAHWRLDETEGVVAADRVGENDGTLHGGPLWQPDGGKMGGALRLDGVDDYVSTAFVLDPAAGPLSVFAWVKGGAPGQVILSQAGGANWLMVGDPGGVLATELKESGRKGKPLVSAAVITDGAWHCVGLVWDGSNRILYVDDIEVARDTQSGLAASTGGLYIGAGNTMAPASFWKGLIDDVRIYDRAVTP